MTKVCVQFVTDTPGDWVEYDSDYWGQVPPLPVNAICIQGVTFSGYDHYTVVSYTGGGCRAICWKDDTHDYLPGMYQARIFNFPPYGPEEWRRGAINPRQTSEVYAGAELMAYYTALGDKAPVTRQVFTYNQFIIPAGANILHGKWVTDPMFEALYQSRRHVGWRDWGENGDGEGEPVPDQRPLGRFKKPLGTLTFFMVTTATASSVHTSNNDLGLSQTVGGSELSAENIGAAADEFTHLFSSPAGEPGVTWPTDVNGTLDASAVGSSVDFGFLSLGGTAGHIARVNTGLTADVDSKTQSESLFEGAGVKIFTVNGAWGAGSDVNDRLEAALAGLRPADHGNEPLEIRMSADSFITGAWAAAAADDEDWAASQTRGTQEPLFRKKSVNSYRQMLRLGLVA